MPNPDENRRPNRTTLSQAAAASASALPDSVLNASASRVEKPLTLPHEKAARVASPRAGSRAERLMREAIVREQTCGTEPSTGAVRHAPQPAPGPAPSLKPAVRARALNKRIRDVLREQTEVVYGTMGTPTDDPDEQTAVSEEEAGFPRARRTPSTAPADAHPGSLVTPTPSKSASSWEDIANEMTLAPTGRRGLATGAMRGGSVRDPNAPKAHPTWRSAPENPKVIHGLVPSRSTLLHDALQGDEKLCDRHGAHYLLSRPAREYDELFAGITERMAKILEREVFPSLSGLRPEDLLFVDIETTGLSSSAPLFLVGALTLDDTEPRLDLFLARDYPEERAALAAYHALARGKTIVTFNGKSFDWPYIEGRSIGARLDFKRPRGHFDLLHHARRYWKPGLPNCKLQTLELYLCGRTRIDDVPGSQIPRTYHEFVATHAATGCGAHLMAPILHHNALDILTMAELLCIAGEEMEHRS